LAAAVTSTCPLCARARDEREGPYFVCADCQWRWTVSITGTVYVQSAWPNPHGREKQTSQVRQLLESVEGLTAKLTPPWPGEDEARLKQAGFAARDIARLRRVRDATAAAYFNEGVPLATLLAEGIAPLPAEEA
jgi:hypothetical protein